MHSNIKEKGQRQSNETRKAARDRIRIYSPRDYVPLRAWNIAERTIAGYCNPTRIEEDFLELIDRCVAQTPGKSKYHFDLDNLNTHQSESLVCYVAEMEGDIDKLGKKGKSGLLRDIESRAKYLRDQSHYIVFHHTPKHASWLNQIEV
jgi:hypothetical protein